MTPPPRSSGEAEEQRPAALDERGRARLTQRRLLRESRTVRLPLVATVATGMITTALIIAQAVLLARVIAAVFMEGEGLAAVAPDLAWLALISIGRGLADAAFEATGRIGASRVMGELRLQLAASALAGSSSRPTSSRDRDGEGGAAELVAAAVDGVDSLEAWFARYLPQAVLSILAPLAILAWVIPLDWPAALILLVTAPLIPIFMILIGLATESRSRRRWRLLARLSTHFLDRVSGLETLRINGVADAQAEAIASVGESYRRETMATLRIGFLSALVLELLAMLGTAIVAATVGIQLAGGHLDLATGLCVLLLAPELYMPLRRLGSEFHAGAEGISAAERIFTALDDTAPSSDTALRQGEAIEMRDIWFGYDAEMPLLRGVDLRLEPGERLAITGLSGTGKSTLLALLLGLETPQRGELRVPVPPASVSTASGPERDAELLSAWHLQLAWIPQRSVLISGSLADNVRLLAPDADDADLARAIEMAGLGGLVAELPHGLDTEIGEGGRQLSAGQRQRVALARAFLKDAPVVILDEPIAHLDRETAAAVAVAIEQLTRGRTAIITSHRPEAVAVADRVLELREGRLQPVETASPGLAFAPAAVDGSAGIISGAPA